MSYQVIARKFRPQNFNELQGQEHISRTLRRALESGRIHHAYLFTGGRGVGKTSTARILAKALNCTKGPTADPCGECKSCQEITQGISLDVREIDGASNTGVDDVRQIREDVRYLPTSGKYRIYIIDEVHMLSTSAFNALLKTLEEPPAHVIFIFATTEAHKILDTILSRCQRYDFRLLSHTQIFEQLEKICATEKIQITPAALHLLARQAAGSMRDAETLLEQVLPFSDGQLTDVIVTQCLGLIDRKVLNDTLEALADRKPTVLLDMARKLHEFGHDYKAFAQDLLTQLRNLSIVQIGARERASVKDLLDLPDDEFQSLENLSTRLSPEETQRLYRLLAQDFYEITHSPMPRMALEMTLLRMAQTPPLQDIAQLLDEVRALKGKTVAQSVPAPPRPSPQAQWHNSPSKPAPAPVAAVATNTPLWPRVIDSLKTTHRSLATTLQEARPESCTAQAIVIGVPPKSFLFETLKDPEHQRIIADTVFKLTEQRPTIDIKIIEGMTGPKTESQARGEEKQRLSQQLKDHPAVKDLQSVLGAEIQDVKHIDT